MIKEFEPANEKQKKFMESLKKYLMLSGAVAAGKSLIGCQKGFLLNMMYPGNRGLICRKEARSLPGSTIHTLFSQVIPKGLIVSYNQMKGELIHKTPLEGVHSTIMFSGLDKRADQSYPTKIGSTEYGWIFADEGIELDEGDWMMLSTRLRYKIPRYSFEQNSKIPRQMFTATNPDSPYHWLHKFFFQTKDKDREVFLTTPYDNPYLPEDYLKALEGSLTGISRERLLYGKWVIAEGVIYTGFNPNTQVVDDSEFLPYKDYKELIVGADSNYPLPRAAILIGVRGDGTIDVLDEFYKEAAHVEQLCDWITEIYKVADNCVKVYHDPSDPTAIDKLSITEGAIVNKAANKVVPGISEVSRYFDNNLIRINEKCQNLIKELLSYSWELNKKGDKPKKVNDHLCFIAGTKIFTENGWKNIEEIDKTDYVLTRKGYRKTLIQFKTPKQSLYEVKFSNGQTLIGTKNHPVWVDGKGFIKIRDLRKNYKVEHITNNLWYQEKYNIIKEKSTLEEKERSILKAIGSTCTELSGKITLGRFHKGIIYIISTGILATTIFLIFSVLKVVNIYRNISKGVNKILNILRGLLNWQKSGIDRMKGENGTKNMESKLGRVEYLLLKSVFNVRKSLRILQEGIIHSSVQTNANQQKEEKKKLMKSKKDVHYAKQSLKLTNTGDQDSVHVVAVRKLTGRENVYNLTVDDQHEYYANGVLVSNCDSIRYALYSHRMNMGEFVMLDDKEGVFF